MNVDLVIVRTNYGASPYEGDDRHVVFHNIAINAIETDITAEITVHYKHTVEEHGYDVGDLDFDTFLWPGDKDTSENIDTLQAAEGFIFDGIFFPVSNFTKEEYLKQIHVYIHNAILETTLEKLD